MRKDIEKFLVNPNYSCLLMGQRGLPLEEDATELAKLLLKTTDKLLLQHPDFLLVDTDKKSLGVEEVDEIINKASLVPALADKIVVLIKGFDRLTEIAQNMLLKLIEESQTVLIIGTCYQDNILETIKSRCCLFYYRPYSEEQFAEYCKKNSIADSSLLYFLTNGCPGLINEEPEVLETFKKVSENISQNTTVNLLATLHLLEEKDKDNFYTKHPAHVRSLMRLLNSLFQKKWVSNPKNNNYKQICALLNADISSCSKVTYTKDNFFYLIAQIITIGGN